MELSVAIYSTVSPFESRSHGGAETSLKLIAESLVKVGIKVVYITTSKRRKFKTCVSETRNGVRIYTLHPSIIPPTRFTRIRVAIRKWNEKNFHRQVLKIFRYERINTVYTYYELDSCLFFLKLKDQLSFKYIIRIAGMHWYEKIKRKPSRLKLYQKIFNNVDGLNFISIGLVKIFEKRIEELELDYNPKKTIILDIGVEVNQLNTRTLKHASTQKNEPFKLLMAARLASTAKRQDILLKAVSLVPRNVKLKLYLVGSGPQKDLLAKQIQQLDIEDRVQMIPFVNQNELWDIMSEIDLICHACDYEGLSKIIIESMGLGLPVLASDVLPLNMYIVDGNNSFLVENNPKKWADKIYQLHSDRESLKNVGGRAKAFVDDEFNSRKNVYKYVEFFQNL